MKSPVLLNVFCYQPDLDQAPHLTKLPLDLWQGILRGTHPFPSPATATAALNGTANGTANATANGTVNSTANATANREKRLILVASRDNNCLSIDPIKVQVDTAGYLKTLDASVTALPDDVVDLRARFIQRYLERHHAWEPTTPVLLTALQRSNCILPTQTNNQPQFATD